MSDPQVVASRYAPPAPARRQLWKAAIKWPMYSVAVMPVLLAAGWLLGQGQALRWGQLMAFLLAAVLLLAWENLPTMSLMPIPAWTGSVSPIRW